MIYSYLILISQELYYHPPADITIWNIIPTPGKPLITYTGDIGYNLGVL